jgi:hypothetical protein
MATINIQKPCFYFKNALLDFILGFSWFSRGIFWLKKINFLVYPLLIDESVSNVTVKLGKEIRIFGYGLKMV